MKYCLHRFPDRSGGDSGRYVDRGGVGAFERKVEKYDRRDERRDDFHRSERDDRRLPDRGFEAR